MGKKLKRRLFYAGSAKSGESVKGDGLLPIPSHIYAGEPLFHCKTEAVSTSLNMSSSILPPPSYSPLPPTSSLLSPDMLYHPPHHHHLYQPQELSAPGINFYQYYQVHGLGGRKLRVQSCWEAGLF